MCRRCFIGRLRVGDQKGHGRGKGDRGRGEFEKCCVSGWGGAPAPTPPVGVAPGAVVGRGGAVGPGISGPWAVSEPVTLAHSRGIDSGFILYCFALSA